MKKLLCSVLMLQKYNRFLNCPNISSRNFHNFHYLNEKIKF